MPMQVKEAVIRLEKNKNKKINLSERQRKSFRSEQSGQQHQKDLKDHRRWLKWMMTEKQFPNK